MVIERRPVCQLQRPQRDSNARSAISLLAVRHHVREIDEEVLARSALVFTAGVDAHMLYSQSVQPINMDLNG